MIFALPPFFFFLLTPSGTFGWVPCVSLMTINRTKFSLGFFGGLTTSYEVCHTIVLSLLVCITYTLLTMSPKAFYSNSPFPAFQPSQSFCETNNSREKTMNQKGGKLGREWRGQMSKFTLLMKKTNNKLKENQFDVVSSRQIFLFRG